MSDQTPIVVLVHGAIAESESWYRVERLTALGIDAAAVTNPLRNIPAAVQRDCAQRAGAREVFTIQGASHAVSASHPDDVARAIDHALAVVTSADAA